VTERDPHIHVEVNLHADAAMRNIMASTFHLAGDLPSVVTTGCGLQVPYAMTSPRPESVTCLACREYAHGQHLHLAEQVERLGRMPGATVSSERTVQAAKRHRDIARRFAETS
jgi:hypothetical protein